MDDKKHNKTVLIKENDLVDSCKPFVASSILFLSVSVILINLCVSFQPKKKFLDYY